MKATKTSFPTEKKQKLVTRADKTHTTDANASDGSAHELPEHFLQVTLHYQAESVREQQKECVLGYN